LWPGVGRPEEGEDRRKVERRGERESEKREREGGRERWIGRGRTGGPEEVKGGEREEGGTGGGERIDGCGWGVSVDVACGHRRGVQESSQCVSANATES
jgi:hypothetical protein